MEKKKIYKLIDEKVARLPYFVGLYVEYKMADDRAKPNTLLSYLYDYERFFTWLIESKYFDGELNKIPITIIEDLSQDDMTLYQTYLLRETNLEKRTSRNRMISSLKSLFNYLSQIQEDENQEPLLKRNVMAKIEINYKKPSSQELADRLKGHVFETPKEISDFLYFVEHDYIKTIENSSLETGVKKRLINYYHLNRERDLALFSLILGSGLRANEVVMLDLDDIDWQIRACRVERKGKEGKTLVRFSRRAMDNLRAYVDIRKDRYKINSKEKAVFISLPSGPNKKSGRWQKRAAQETVIKYSKWYGKPFTIHNLRHSFATVHWQKNKDVFGLQSQLGHSDPQTTQRYALIFDDTLEREIDNMDE